MSPEVARAIVASFWRMPYNNWRLAVDYLMGRYP